MFLLGFFLFLFALFGFSFFVFWFFTFVLKLLRFVDTTKTQPNLSSF